MFALVIKSHVDAIDPSLTNDVDTTAHDDGPLAANDVGHVTSDESTEESTSRKDRSDQRQVAASQGRVLVGCNLCVDVGIALDESDEDLGAGDTVDVTRIVTEEDTTEGGEGAHEVGLPGDGSLDTLGVGGCGQANRVASVGGDRLRVGSLLHCCGAQAVVVLMLLLMGVDVCSRAVGRCTCVQRVAAAEVYRGGEWWMNEGDKGGRRGLFMKQQRM